VSSTTRPRVLVVCAVPAERDAVLAGIDPDAEPAAAVTAVACGIGPVAAAVCTGRQLASASAIGRPYDLALSAGIAGGFAGRAAQRDTVVTTRSVFADLGALTDDGFLDLAVLGHPDAQSLDSPVAGALAAALPGAVTGSVLTLATMTGTDAAGAALAAAHPDAVAEAMEGFGVAAAAVAADCAWGEVRTISNAVGRRDRSTWDLPGSLGLLGAVGAALVDRAFVAAAFAGTLES
jgi:futalosine hydrolase